MTVRALLFDLDDTLLETHEAHQASLAAACARAAERHPQWSPESLAAVFNETYQRLEDELEAKRLAFSSQFLYRTRVWQEALAACGLPADLGEELATVYLEQRRKLYRVYEDVPWGLSTLAVSFRLVLVTNGLSDLQREKIAAVGLGRWFDRIVVSGEVESWKPDGGIFRRALELAEVPASEAVMIGDNLVKDIGGAAALGMRTVWMRRYPHLQPLRAIQPSAEASDLPGLATVLRTW